MAISIVRAKFTVEKIAKTRYGGCELTLSVDDPLAVEFFELGKPYYLDCSPVPTTVAAGD